MTAARCRCSHVQAAHKTDRNGRIVCVGPCGCSKFRHAKPVEGGVDWTGPAPQGGYGAL